MIGTCGVCSVKEKTKAIVKNFGGYPLELCAKCTEQLGVRFMVAYLIGERRRLKRELDIVRLTHLV